MAQAGARRAGSGHGGCLGGLQYPAGGHLARGDADPDRRVFWRAQGEQILMRGELGMGCNQPVSVTHGHCVGLIREHAAAGSSYNRPLL